MAGRAENLLNKLAGHAEKTEIFGGLRAWESRLLGSLPQVDQEFSILNKWHLLIIRKILSYFKQTIIFH